MKFLVCAYASGFMAPDIKRTHDTFEEALKTFEEAKKDFSENKWSHRQEPEMFVMQKIDPETYKLAKGGAIA